LAASSVIAPSGYLLIPHFLLTSWKRFFGHLTDGKKSLDTITGDSILKAG